ncbi:ATP-dependent protease La [Halteromyces radiatus]|uniref:ATP-dependent protease La n=1 Tax=Halteromyces radiatus TaxID=101107 RepID=UPI00221FD8E6|nr:ATP-dependent protease La [Halteromyces radiatus]KAI8098802.1 ATP-dependent protease La [Halteromyces radiatus]
MTDQVPNSLPLVPLCDKVLLPSIVTKIVLEGTEAKSLIRKMENNDHRFILCVPFKNSTSLHNDLFHMGCVANVLDVDTNVPYHTVLLVQGLCRAQVQDIHGQDLENTLLDVTVKPIWVMMNNDINMTSWTKTIRQLCDDFISKMQMIGVASSVLAPFQTRLAQLTEYQTNGSSSLIDMAHFLLCMTDASFHEKLTVLGLTDTNTILQEIQTTVTRHIQTLSEFKQIQQLNEEKLDRKRREFYLRQQVHVMSAPGMTSEVSLSNLSLLTASSPYSSAKPTKSPSSSTLGIYQQEEDDGCLFMPTQGDDDDLTDLKNQLNKAGLPTHIQTTIKRDVQRLAKIPNASPESILIRTYLEWIADLPWKKPFNSASQNVVEILAAKKQLDVDHFGLEQVKRRILEYLSVLKVKKDTTSPILCFVGPPGVGKTTLGISIAKALQRNFHRIALGGVRDEAEIRGHRRTYVGALPGLIINGLRKCGVNNPLFLLDEIDKLVQGTHQGDPAAALLEVLDPAQNHAFTDHFLNVPFDLSNVLFIATANSMDSIPGPLLDRMEVIQLDGYTMDEKLDIARSYLVPKQLNAHGFTFSQETDGKTMENNGVILSDQVLSHLIENYTLESGVRSLDRVIASVCRYKCREYADYLESIHHSSASYDPVVRNKDLSIILGMAPYGNEHLSDAVDTPGIVTGLAYSQSGCGGILPIEANQMPGHGQLKLTGSLGDVIKESAQLAVSWVKANAYTLNLTATQKQILLPDMDLHLHIPNGAVPKDGPSAGIAMTVCIVSLLSGKAVPRTTAMTGEITLRGQVRPVGGIKEKVLSAHRAGVTKVILPATNERDVVQDIPDKVKKDMTIVYCRSIWEVLDAAFDEKLVQDNRFLYCQSHSASRL